jgi:hypothetical protein
MTGMIPIKRPARFRPARRRLGLAALVGLAPLGVLAASSAAERPLPYPRLAVSPTTPMAGDGGAENPDAGGRRSIPPDPAPLVSREQWVFDLRYDKGDIDLLAVHKMTLREPQATPRAMGRFAIELFEGPTLIERVRFDFPLLGDDEPARVGYKSPPSFRRKLVSRIGVMFPAVDRGTRLELWDRATDQHWPMHWPPSETREAPSDGGPDDAADDAFPLAPPTGR